MNEVSIPRLLTWLIVTALFCCTQVSADENDSVSSLDGQSASKADENASNPLAAVNNTDLKWQYLDLTGGGLRLNHYFIDGAFMANPKLKVKYTLHSWNTNTSGTNQQDMESAVLKLIYFPRQGMFSGGTKYRLALGVDYIHDLGDTEKGIGFGADQVGPFVGIALGLKSGMSVIPLIQHFKSISGTDIKTTALRLIALKPFNNTWWLKADAKVPYDWENETVPASAEFQLGNNISQSKAVYIEGLFGLGSDRIYDWGVGIGFRFKY